MPARSKWTKKEILRQLKTEKELSWSGLRQNNPNLLSACEKHFGSLRKGVETLGFDYDEISTRKPINRKWVIKDIHSFVASGNPLSSLYTTHSALMRKCKRLFGSVAKAFKSAGYRYEDLKRNPGYVSRWSHKDDLLRAIRKLPTTHYTRVHQNHRGLEQRAEKLFGSWGKAVKTAGLMYRPVPPPIWPGELVLKKIRKLRDKSHGANADTKLYHSTRAAFGSWRYAVELAGFPYFEVEPRFRFRPKEVLYYIRWLADRNTAFSGRDYPDLYKNALRFFGSWKNAVRAAELRPTEIHFKHRIKRPREVKSNPEIAREILRA